MFSKIADFFKSIFFPKVKKFFSAVFTKAVTIAIAEIQEIVQNTVKELSYENITNTEKRNEAFKRVAKQLKDEGKEVSESVIRATIELAVIELKNAVGVKVNE